LWKIKSGELVEGTQECPSSSRTILKREDWKYTQTWKKKKEGAGRWGEKGHPKGGYTKGRTFPIL